ncbi:hypothetical protein BN8_02920 [Fibrisoma limi BUZ 3]|uniref:Secretion system C-terminal sorting domain-containing protein n=1 Tax=Fibrisoma limi BUZ 3 TaxID=1185876 RepID=I2GIS1_9BACT|nr:hypothetical protein [Fibrisoma limi]CCH53796.1 hypothetical protein BN8_02920 [Fibrisoma limi BUZ 3]
MKTFLKSALLALILLGAFGAILFLTAEAANARPMNDPALTNPTAPAAVRSMIFPSKSAAVVNVIVDQPAGERSYVQVLDEEGNVLATQVTNRKAGAYHVKFNVAQLPAGKFRIVVQNKANETKHNFEIAQPVPATRLISLN